MGTFFFLVLRRMRAPLVLLILIYTIAIVGLTLIPGIDSQGQPTPPLSIFHAFYFISYTATTIGFGEIPNAFSEGQRLWVLLCIYLSVVGWSYSILTILALVQDSGFRNSLLSARFIWRVKRLGETFYLICGYGETGKLVGHTLDDLGRRFVIIESSQQRVDELDLEDFHTDIPALSANASLPENLLIAGLKHPRCQGVLALTNSDETNLAIAITVRLLNPNIPVIARSEQFAISENMASFGTDYVINPFQHFADYLGLAIQSPACYQLIERLTGVPGSQLPTPLPRPPAGHWVICGYGRFGQAIAQHFDTLNLDYTIIDPRKHDGHDKLQIISTGTEAEPLKAAGIQTAIGLIAGTEHDINNLSIAMTAKQLNPELFMVMRQNQIANSVLFDAFKADLTMVPSQIVAQQCLARLSTPLLAHFLDRLEAAGEHWAEGINKTMQHHFEQTVPELWNIKLNAQEARAVHRGLALSGLEMKLADLLVCPYQREAKEDMIPLLLQRGEEFILMPDRETPLAPGDWLLFAGSYRAKKEQRLILLSEKVLHYVLTGQDLSRNWLLEKLNPASRHNMPH